MIKALLWNEWRQKSFGVLLFSSVFFLLWAGLWSAAWFIPRWISKNIVDLALIVICLVIAIVPLLLSVSKTALAEKRKSLSFLLGLPVSPSQIYWCRYGFDMCLFTFLVIANMILTTHFLNYMDMNEMYYASHKIIQWVPLLIPFQSIMFSCSLAKEDANVFGVILFLFALMILGLTMMMGVNAVILDMEYSVIQRQILYFSPAIALIALAILLLPHGWFVWVFNLSRGLQATKILAQSTLIALILSGLLYGYAMVSFHRMRSEAVKLNIIAATYGRPVAEADNAAEPLRQFNNLYNSFYRKMSKKECKMLYSDPWLSPLNNVQKKIITMLNSPSGHQMLEYLDKALQKPYCRFSPSLRNCWADGRDEFLNARIILYYQAVNMRQKGDDASFSATIKKMYRLYELRWEMSADELAGNILFAACRTAVYSGPDTADFIGFYRDMIEKTDHAHIYASVNDYREISQIFTSSILINLVPVDMAEIQTLKRNIAEMQLIVRSGRSYPDVKDEGEKLEQVHPVSKQGGCFGMVRYFHHKNEITVYKLLFALKIYNIQHGSFPEKLAQLVPGILPEIPFAPMTGAEFIYQRKGNGVTITDKDERGYGSFITEYHPEKTGKITETKP